MCCKLRANLLNCFLLYLAVVHNVVDSFLCNIYYAELLCGGVPGDSHLLFNFTDRCSYDCPTGYLRGVEVIDHTTFTYTGRAQSFEWSKFGFKIHFPDNAVPGDVDKCHINVKASLSGQFHFPKDMELISGVYWIACPHKFTKPVTVEIQHCAAKPCNLTYIAAKCTQEDLPYQFKTLEGGVFSPSSHYGSINLNHFSGLGIALRWSSFTQMFGLRTHQPESNTRSYCARLYYSSSGINCWEVYFAIVCNLELHIAVSISISITEIIVIDNQIFRLGFQHSG